MNAKKAPPAGKREEQDKRDDINASQPDKPAHSEARKARCIFCFREWTVGKDEDVVVRHLESTGILTIERVDKPRKVLLLELTDKGMLLGSLLAEMEDTAYLPAEHIPTRNQIRLLIALEEYEEKPSQRKLRAAVNGSRFGTKLMRDGLVEKIEQKPYMKLTDKGKKIASELKHTFESLKQT